LIRIKCRVYPNRRKKKLSLVVQMHETITDSLAFVPDMTKSLNPNTPQCSSSFSRLGGTEGEWQIMQVYVLYMLNHAYIQPDIKFKINCTAPANYLHCLKDYGRNGRP
jgi:hypothetical protein